MAWDEEFFIQPRLTSKLKHLVLEAYVKEFAYHLGSAQPVVYYIDGFAGAGVYGDGPNREDGSPLVIAKLSQRIRGSSRPFDLRCLNIEANRERFDNLERATEPFRPQIVEKNYRGEFAEELPDILNRIGSAPAFFFIDPFGTKDIPFKKLLPIFTRRHTTEVLITLQTDGIAKKAGYFAREDDLNVKTRGTARKFTAHLADALNVSHEKLRAAWKEEQGNTPAFEKRALNYYLKRLRSSGFAFTKAFKVVYYRAERLTEAPVCFHLVFGTRHEKGLFEMNDSMTEALGAFYRQVYSGSFFPEFEAERERLVGAAAVNQEIKTVFAQKYFTIDDVKRHCMQDTDFQLKGSEYRKLIVSMATGGDLRKLTKGPVSNSTTMFSFRLAKQG